MSTPYDIPETNIPLPTKGTDVITPACDYCIFACGYTAHPRPGTGERNGRPA